MITSEEEKFAFRLTHMPREEMIALRLMGKQPVKWKWLTDVWSCQPSLICPYCSMPFIITDRKHLFPNLAKQEFPCRSCKRVVEFVPTPELPCRRLDGSINE